MKHCVRLLLTLVLSCFGPTGVARAPHPSASIHPIHPAAQPVSLAHGYSNLPSSFEPNRGQFDSAISFGSQRPAYSLLLNATSATLKMHNSENSQTASLTMQFQGANESSTVRGLNQLSGVTNYFYGARRNWITSVPNYEKVRVENMYPGIDAVYYGNHSRFEYDLIVKPGGSPDQIDIVFDRGANLAVDDTGDLVITLPDHQVRQSKPLIYQP